MLFTLLMRIGTYVVATQEDEDAARAELVPYERHCRERGLTTNVLRTWLSLDQTKRLVQLRVAKNLKSVDEMERYWPTKEMPFKVVRFALSFQNSRLFHANYLLGSNNPQTTECSVIIEPDDDGNTLWRYEANLKRKTVEIYVENDRIYSEQAFSRFKKVIERSQKRMRVERKLRQLGIVHEESLQDPTSEKARGEFAHLHGQLMKMVGTL